MPLLKRRAVPAMAFLLNSFQPLAISYQQTTIQRNLKFLWKRIYARLSRLKPLLVCGSVLIIV
jgi:hypothetical protein